MTSWSLDVLAGSVVLSLNEVIVPGESGDLIVNLADYTLSRERLCTREGTPGSLTLADGDANGDGLVDSKDYDVWKSRFGTVLASSSLQSYRLIPEPSSSVAMWGAVIALVYNWRRLLRV